MQKICKRCQRNLDISEFYKHKMMGDGHLSFCKECTKKRVKKHRENNLERIQEYDRSRGMNTERVAAREEYRKTESGKQAFARARRKYRTKYPDRNAARGFVYRAIRSGKITKPDCCSECGATGRIHGHHEDYTKPLDVVWLCPACHTRRHRG